MQYKVQGEAPFQILASNFSIGPSNEGYTLQISADGVNYSDLFSVGANVTRMVTGVANGSFYRLSGNESLVIVNWNKQCNDGGSGGSGSQGPQGPAGPEGAQGPQGPQGTAGINDFLKAQNGLPEGLNDGDVFATSGGVYQLQGEKTEYQWTTLEDWSQTPFTQVRVPYAQSAGFAIRYEPTGITNIDVGFEWNGSTWDTSFNTGTITDGEFSGSENGMTATCVHSGEYLIITFAGWPITFSWNWNNAEAYVAVAVPNYVKVGDSNFIHLDSIPAEGEEGKVYEYNGKLMTWNPNSGYTAEWASMPQNPASAKDGYTLAYAAIPDGQVIFESYYSNRDHRIVMMSGGTLYQLETGGTVVCAVTIGNTFKFENIGGSTMFITGEYGKQYISFQSNNSNNFANVWDGSVSGGHFELIDKYIPSTIEAGSGVVKVDSKGRITGYAAVYAAQDIYFNTTGSTLSAKLRVLKDGANGGPNTPRRIFTPSNGGEAGQVLVSAGNAEPTWATLIKSVKITSDAYEALVQAGTVDPNTLYLIVDE